MPVRRNAIRDLYYFLYSIETIDTYPRQPSVTTTAAEAETQIYEMLSRIRYYHDYNIHPKVHSRIIYSLHYGPFAYFTDYDHQTLVYFFFYTVQRDINCITKQYIYILGTF